jgi:hypothetical protein
VISLAEAIPVETISMIMVAHIRFCITFPLLFIC